MATITDPQTQSSDTGVDAYMGAVPEASLGNTDYNQRLYPRQLSTGSLRGTQTVGYGGVKIDGSNDQITIGSTTNSQGQSQETIIGQLNPANTQDQSFGIKVIDAAGGQLLIGILPDGNLGMQILDASGNEVMRTGYLPVSGVYGWATATPNNTLAGQV